MLAREIGLSAQECYDLYRINETWLKPNVTESGWIEKIIEIYPADEEYIETLEAIQKALEAAQDQLVVASSG
jgi:hypothetical protein